MVKRTCLSILFCMALGITYGGTQGSESADNEQTAPGEPTMHYALVGESSRIQVAIDLDKFVIEWFENNVAGFDQMSQAEKDDIARKLLADESLDYVDVRLVNDAGRTIMMNVMGDTLTVSFRKAQAKYNPDIEDTNYPSRLLENSQTEVRFPIAISESAAPSQCFFSSYTSFKLVKFFLHSSSRAGFAGVISSPSGPA